MSRLLRFFLTVMVCSEAFGHGPVVRVVTFDTEITQVTARRILQAIDDGEAARDDLVVIELDTPGGDVAATEDVVKRILSAKVPVAAWVGPAGARAASGGFYLLIAADVAAMAPGTRTGAASAVYGFGKSEDGDVLLKKITSDLAALARSIAEHRGRDVASCEKAVTSADAFTDEAALKSGLVDLVARDRADLLGKLDGRSVLRFDGTKTTLALAGATIVGTEPTRSERIEERVGGFLSNPTVAYLLFLIGLAGLYAEFNHPGATVPGVVGAIALILFVFGAHTLPVSMLGLLLVVTGLVLFVAELKIGSHGLLTLGGIVGVVAGSVLLFPGKGGDVRPPLTVVLPGSLTLATLCIVATRLAIKARSARVQTGREGLLGEIGVVQRSLAPEGTVFVHGEIWRAVAARSPVPEGARVRVVNVRDLVVDVEPVDAAR